MSRIILAVAAAFALSAAAPAFACPDCKDCPHHQDHAAADKAEKKDGEAKKCSCGATTAKDCKCAGGKCDCHAKKDEKKEQKQKS